MELNYLRVFYEVAKVGRFTEAARRLRISQSALSRSVALLEESEGVQLFERSKQGVELTRIGKEVFRRCEEMFRTFHEIEGLCKGTRETCEGPLTIATTDHVANELLIQPLQDFRSKFPKVIPTLVMSTPDGIVESLVKGNSEIGLLFVKVPLPQIEYEILRSEKMALVCHPDVWARAKSSSVQKTLRKALQNEGYIASIGASREARPLRVLRELFGEVPRIGFEVSAQETQKRICLAGGGVAYLARFMVEREIEDGRLFEIPVESPHSFHFWAATRKGSELTLTARSFLEHLGKGVG
jgi:LysR family transcriptional regulator, cyn operon transcriptional activator